MGLADEFFWSLTLPLFMRLWERHKARERMLDRRSGEIAATLAEINRDEKIRPNPFTWLDFYPEHSEPEQPQTEEQMLMALQTGAVIHK